jgi:hypothetical protein
MSYFIISIDQTFVEINVKIIKGKNTGYFDVHIVFNINYQIDRLGLDRPVFLGHTI